MNKYTSNSSKGCVLEVGLEYLKELHELHNYHPLASDKIEIKKEMLSNYQIKVADYNIPISYVKNWCLAFLIKKSMCFINKIWKFI